MKIYQRFASRKALASFLFAFLAISFSLKSQAANPSDDLRIEVMKAYNFIVDSNVEAPSSYGPRSAYLGAKFCNDGATAITNVTAYIGNYTNNTPGIYPARTHLALTGTFSLTHEGGRAGTRDATRYLDRIEPGECVQVYWLVSYPLKDDLGKAVWGPSVKPDDDLFLFYDVWATATREGLDISADQRQKVTMRNEITASANKIFPNSANKVPVEYKALLDIYAPTWTNVTLGGNPGDIIQAEGYWYDLGLVNFGFDNDGDLVPDQNAWLQPVGDPARFDPGCFRLIRTYAFVVVKVSGGEVVYTAEDQLYFENLPDNRGSVGFVGYEFIVLGESCGSLMVPYQEVASGYDNEKYNSDFGSTAGGILQAGTSDVFIAKSASPTVVPPGGIVSYTVVFTNTGTTAVGNPSKGLPLAIHDAIPTGTVYVAGSAAASNVLPSGVTSYTILYSTNSGALWSQIEPSPATNVTDIQWWLSDPMPVSSTGTVHFQVTVDNPYTNDSPRIDNTAGLAIDGGPTFKEDTAYVFLEGSNLLDGTVFADIGGGGGVLADGLLNGSETGITGILVTLYYDLNDDGLRDSGDILMDQTNAAAGITNYQFSALPDGNYIVTVDPDDADMPFGYTPTTNILLTAALDPAGTNASGVEVHNLDFGFAPILDVVKAGPATAVEGELITYTITVTNHFAGDGSASLAPQTLTLHPTGVVATLSTGWTTTTNIHDFPVTGTYAQALSAGTQAKTLGVDGYQTAALSSSITNVIITIPYTVVGNLQSADTFTLRIITNLAASAAIYSNVFDASLFGAAGTFSNYVENITTNTTWTWDFFDPDNDNFFIEVGYTRNNNQNPSRGIGVDTVAITLQTGSGGGAACEQIFDPVPLYDYFDTNVLDYVSSSPPAQSVGTNGMAPNTGSLFWPNVGPVYPGGDTGSTVSVTFRVLEPAGNVSQTTTNTAAVIGAQYQCGGIAGNATSTVATTILPSGSLGDFVWRDLNSDGVQDGGDETGIEGVSVVLTPPAGMDLGNGAGNPITNVTDATGYYLFDGLPSNGIYTVTVLTNTLPGGVGTNTYDRDSGTVSPDNTASTNLNVLATDGTDDALSLDFGYSGLNGLISGRLWEDVDCDGASTRGSGEPYLSGITIELVSNGTVIATTTTDTSGFYSFTSNFVGAFTVRVDTNSAGFSTNFWRAAYDSDGLSGSTNVVALTMVAGGSGTADFGYCQENVYSIGDTIFYDWDGDGTQDAADEGISNVTVRLYRDTDGDGVYDPGGDPLVGTQVTIADGTYLFENIISNDYIVVVDAASPGLPATYNITADPDATLDGVSALTITNANNLLQDFGYQPTGFGVIGDTVWRDLNVDQQQAGFTETGISNITVNLKVDQDNNGIYVTIASAVTDAQGKYLFTNLAAVTYRVEVDLTDTDLPEDQFGTDWYITTAATTNIPLGVNATNLTADFGFAPYGAIGDTIFFDPNRSGTQDYNEGGISNVTVFLYVDQDADGFFSPGDTLAKSTTTDSNGLYLFTGLLPTNYVVLVDTNGPVNGLELSADPSADGLPCSDIAATGCDHQYGYNLLSGQVFTGADFGYVPADGTLGDTVWIDFDNDGVKDNNEIGIPFITVLLYTNGTLVATTETDSDGLYLFYGLADGVYYVVVDTNDVDWPSGVSQSYDPDNTFDSVGTNVIMSAGSVTNIGTAGCANCDLNVDFGYRYASTNVLRGTIGLDDPDNIDGVMGTNTYGYTTNEVPFAGVTMLAYLWNDDGDGILESGEAVLVNTTTTDADGNYEFTDLPLGDGDDLYLISMSVPQANLTLTTTTNVTPATVLQNTTNLQGYAQSTWQAMPVEPLIENVDFAYISTLDFDFGDAPTSYDTLLPYGARHAVGASTNLYLGSIIDIENNGFPTSGADGDDLNASDDEDGVAVTSRWTTGSSGGSVQVTVGLGTGYLAGYVDFDQSDNFVGADDLIISQTVSNTGGPSANGVYSFNFDVPETALPDDQSSYFYSRFRLFPSAPLFPALAYSGEAANGEVEDYYWAFHVINGSVFADENDNTNINAGVDRLIPGVVIYLYDSNTNLVGTTVTDLNGKYSFSGLLDDAYRVVMTTPTGATAIADADGGGNSFTNIDVTISGSSAFNRDYLVNSNASLASLSGTVFDDDGFGVAGNGIFDAPDEEVPGVVVALYNDINGNSIADSDEFIGSVPTDGLGAYSFTNLPDANYIITMQTPGASTNVTDIDGDANGKDLIEVTLAGVDITGRDFLLDNVEFAARIGDRVWFDFDGDGVQDLSEDRLMTNIPVYLVSTAGFNVAETVTGTNGYYYFDNVPVGTYFVRFDLRSITSTGNLQVTVAEATANDELDSDALTGDVGGFADTGNYTVTANTTNLSIDLGIAYKLIKTRAVIADVAAEWADGQGRLVWETGSEWGTAGFFVYRVDPETGEETLLNDEMVLSAFQPGGAVYELVDPDATEGATMTYRIEELEIFGDLVNLGTHTVTCVRPAKSKSALKALAKQAEPVYATLNTSLSGPSSCLSVSFRKSGLYAVSIADIASGMGLGSSEVAAMASASGLNLSAGGRNELAYAYDEAGQRILFYGQATRDFYGRDQVVMIRQGTGLLMNRRAPGASGGGRSTLPVVERFEEDQYFFDSLAQIVDDLFYWEYIITGNATMGSRSFPLDLTGYAGGDINLTVNLIGWSLKPHRAEISVNGTVVGVVDFMNQQQIAGKLTVPEVLISNGVNNVTVRGLHTGVSGSFFVVDWLEAAFERQLAPVAGSGHFTARELSVISGEAFADPVVLSIMNAHQPVLVAGSESITSAGSWLATHHNEKFVVAEYTGIPSLTPQPATCDAWFTGDDVEVDYLVIASRAMTNAAQALVDYRAAQGLRVGVAVFEDVCDIFRDGFRTPEAVQDLIRYAVANWRSPPWLVLLAGNGHYDYLQALPGSGFNPLPPLLYVTDRGIAAADGLFTDVDGDNLPDIAIGRLPATSEAELTLMINKIIAHEADHGATWQKNMTVIADANESAGALGFAADFSGDSDTITTPASGTFSVEHVYRDQQSLTQVRTNLMNSFNQGAGIIHYTGHGNLRQMGNGDAILKQADVQAMVNAQQPLVIALSCMVGRYETPTEASLGELLLRQPGAGAVAVWSPSGNSTHEDAVAIGAEFYDALLQGDAVTVGLAIQQTAERVKDDPGARENMITYNLLGDPAMKVAGLTGQGRGVSGFAQWRWAIFSPDQLTNDAVSGVHGSLGDKDGANFLHYALGTTPGGPVKPEDVDLWDAVDEEGFVFKARRRALGRDIVYRLRVSEDLENWQEDPVDVETLSVEQDPGGETETVRMRVNRPNAKRLYIGRKFIYEP